MAGMVIAVTPVLLTVIIFGSLISIGFAGAGVWLVMLGASGDTTFQLFGQSFHSTNVGIAAIFIAAVVATLVIRRALNSLDHAASNDDDDDPDESDDDADLEGSNTHRSRPNKALKPTGRKKPRPSA